MGIQVFPVDELRWIINGLAYSMTRTRIYVVRLTHYSPKIPLTHSTTKPTMMMPPRAVNRKSATIPALLPCLFGIEADSERQALDGRRARYVSLEDQAIGRRVDPYHFG